MNTGLQITLIDSKNDFTPQERGELWDKGVDLDDWDYAIIVPADELDYDESYEDTESGRTILVKRYFPKNFNLERMTQSTCSTTWYKINFRDKDVGIGVVYH